MSETEETIKEIWCQEFQRNDISIYDNFFEIGGDSIKGMNIFHALEKKFGYIINVSEIFEYQTISEISNYVDKLKKNNSKKSNKLTCKNINDNINDIDDIDEVIRLLNDR